METLKLKILDILESHKFRKRAAIMFVLFLTVYMGSILYLGG